MKREDMAFAIFLKRLPVEPLTDSNRKWIKSKADESFELADTFIAAQKENAAARSKKAEGEQ